MLIPELSMPCGSLSKSYIILPLHSYSKEHNSTTNQACNNKPLYDRKHVVAKNPHSQLFTSLLIGLIG